MQGTSTELFLRELKMLLTHLSKFIIPGSSERGSKSNDLLSSQEDWGRRREQGASLGPDTWTENESANFQCLILKNLASVPQKDLWKSLTDLSLASGTPYSFPLWGNFVQFGLEADSFSVYADGLAPCFSAQLLMQVEIHPGRSLPFCCPWCT